MVFEMETTYLFLAIFLLILNMVAFQMELLFSYELEIHRICSIIYHIILVWLIRFDDFGIADALNLKFRVLLCTSTSILFISNKNLKRHSLFSYSLFFSSFIQYNQLVILHMKIIFMSHKN